MRLWKSISPRSHETAGVLKQLECVMETSPEFDQSPIEPPAKKIHKRLRKNESALLRKFVGYPYNSK